MAVAKIASGASVGVNAITIDVEVSAAAGLFSYTTVGLPDTAIRESQERVLSALRNVGFTIPIKKFTINLAPANIKKEGSSFDLPIAIGILKTENLIKADLSNIMILGELSLDGRIKPTRGAISVAMQAMEEKGITKLILPAHNAKEAAVVEGIDVIAVSSLGETIEFLEGERLIEPTRVHIPTLFATSLASDNLGEADFSEVKGQQLVKRALEVAAAGSHNILMIGPPGSGKSMMAKRTPSILTDITFEEALETTKIHSFVGMTNNGEALVTKRPFRSPHHTISDAGLIGGSSTPLPGEVSLAHNGVLFLDELPEFRRNTLEALRQPLEDGEVTITRATTAATYPAKFMLIASMNPCPCGYLDSKRKECSCSYSAIKRYKSRVSGPLLDRFDIHVETPDVKIQNIVDDNLQESSSQIKKRVNKARLIQAERFKSLDKIFCNRDLQGVNIRKFCKIDSSSKELLKNAVEKLGLSARAYDKILKLARTIADLESSANIEQENLFEAIQFRSLDREEYS
ncbi:MAG: YifB family Mg chelatase-like AAA ATPase [Nitrospinota bacterium]